MKYLVDIRNEAWLNFFWENLNGNLSAVNEIIDGKWSL
jgi:hypothetical protein